MRLGGCRVRGGRHDVGAQGLGAIRGLAMLLAGYAHGAIWRRGAATIAIQRGSIVFFRKKGRGFQLIHSYRDGQGRVRQLRVATLLSREEALTRLEPVHWDIWIGEVSKRVPHLTVEGEKLRERLLALTRLMPEGPMSDGEKAKVVVVARKAREKAGGESSIWRRVEGLRQELEQGGDRELWASVLESLQLPPEAAGEGESERVMALREALEASRRLRRSHRLRTDRTSPETQAHLQLLESLAGELEGRGRWGEAVRLRSEQVNLTLEVEARAQLALTLQMSGRWREAERQYGMLPGTSALRHYGLGSLAFQRGRREEAFDHAVKALFRDRWLAVSEAFWAGAGQGWGEDGRVFVWAISQQFPIRWEIRLREERVSGPGGPLPSLAPLERSGILRKLGVAHKVPISNRVTSSMTRWRWSASHEVMERTTKGDEHESIDKEPTRAVVSLGAVGL